MAGSCPALAGNAQGIGQSRICQSQGRRSGNSARDIGYGIMNDTVLGKGRILVGGNPVTGGNAAAKAAANGVLPLAVGPSIVIIFFISVGKITQKMPSDKIERHNFYF